MSTPGLTRCMVGLALLCGGLTAGCADRSDVNFQEIIATAKTRVFPALVFVKPICEVR